MNRTAAKRLVVEVRRARERTGVLLAELEPGARDSFAPVAVSSPAAPVSSAPLALRSPVAARSPVAVRVVGGVGAVLGLGLLFAMFRKPAAAAEPPSSPAPPAPPAPEPPSSPAPEPLPEPPPVPEPEPVADWQRAGTLQLMTLNSLTGYRRAKQAEVGPEMLREAASFLKHPVGSLHFVELDGKQYAVALEEHTNRPELGTKNKGVSIFLKDEA